VGRQTITLALKALYHTTLLYCKNSMPNSLRRVKKVYPNPKQKTIYNQPQWLQYLTTFDFHVLQIQIYCYKANGSAESLIKFSFRST